MSARKNDFSAIRIGTRIRHTADGAVGRIVWANATTVKVQWDDGEKVNWKRADLASKGLEILDDEQAAESQAVEASTEESTALATNEAAEPTVASEPAVATTPTGMPADGTTEALAATEPTATEQPAELPKKRRARANAPEGTKKTSAIDAAAKALAEAGKPMGCQELIGAMAAKGYWTSPGGKTPAATLYSSFLREIDTKGDAARFVKIGRGLFALRPQA
jgi:HB1/ASXL restriction endonuclease-like protein with HTH domain